MNEVIKWGAHAYEAGDTFSLANDHRAITILDMFEDNAKAYVVLKFHSYNPEMWPADLFAYCVETGYFKKTQEPLYSKGDRFTHQYNNDTIEVLSVAPSVSVTGVRYYFVLMIDGLGGTEFVTLDETYLSNCIMQPKISNEGIEKPIVPIGAVFPSVSYHVTTP